MAHQQFPSTINFDSVTAQQVIMVSLPPNHNIPGPPPFRYFPPGSILSQILLVLAAATAFILGRAGLGTRQGSSTEGTGTVTLFINRAVLMKSATAPILVCVLWAATQIPVVDAAGNDSIMYGSQWLPAVTTKISDGKDTELSANKRKTKIKTGWAGSSSNSTTASASGLGCSSPSSTARPWARGGSASTS